MEDQTIVIQESPNYLMPVMTMQAVIQRRAAVVEFTAKAMKRGVDFGVIPGTGDKPTLLKPGAEKLCTLFGLSPRFAITNKIEDWNGRDYDGEPMFYYTYKCGLWYQDHLVAEGEGSCNSHEKKYRYRDSKRKCPSCGKETIIKGKTEYGGGWLCFKKAGGCGVKFEDADDRITYQQIGPVLNPDIADQVNTIQKMAQKRALIAATLLAVNASEFFTQDLDDMVIEHDAGPQWTEPLAESAPVIPQAPEPAKPPVVGQANAKLKYQPFVSWCNEWVKSNALAAKYAREDGDLANMYHILGRVAQLGFSEVTEANVEQIKTALANYVAKAE